MAGWYDNYWALIGTPGSTSSRVVHWGRARDGSDGRGTDGLGSVTGTVPQFRENFAVPVELLERPSGSAVPVDRVCDIAGGPAVLLIRAIDDTGNTTDCNPGSAKTVWIAGRLDPFPTVGVVTKLPGLPASNTTPYSPPKRVFFGATSSGSPPLVVVLEDGSAYGLGLNPYNGFGTTTPAPYYMGSAAGVAKLRDEWGKVGSVGVSFLYSVLAVRSSDGSVWASGKEDSGELGLGTTASATINGPVEVYAETCTALTCTDRLKGVTAVVSNDNLTTFALKNGNILGWGKRVHSLLGADSLSPQLFPTQITSAVSGFTAVSSGASHVLVIGPQQVVYAWGSGSRGALGDGIDGGKRAAPGMVSEP